VWSQTAARVDGLKDPRVLSQRCTSTKRQKGREMSFQGEKGGGTNVRRVEGGGERLVPGAHGGNDRRDS